MREDPATRHYGYEIVNYISVVLIGTGIAGLALAIVFTVLGFSAWVLALCWVLGAVLLACGLFWHLSMGPFADSGNTELLARCLMDLLATRWDGKGKALDIGTGLGFLAIEVAKRFPESQVIGVDTWTRMWRLWGMSQAGAERNARVEKVDGRCTFRPASALHLPFEDGEFQLAVSSFVFHEIQVPDRTVLIQEAARVLAPGGLLLICDVTFPKGYGVRNVAELLSKVEALGLEEVAHTPLKEAGVDLGGLSSVWGPAYLSAKKASTA